jgi:hypothetical protein
MTLLRDKEGWLAAAGGGGGGRAPYAEEEEEEGNEEEEAIGRGVCGETRTTTDTTAARATATTWLERLEEGWISIKSQVVAR